MATIDNDSAVEFTANWTDALTGLGFYSALTGGLDMGIRPLQARRLQHLVLRLESRLGIWT